MDWRSTGERGLNVKINKKEKSFNDNLYIWNDEHITRSRIFFSRACKIVDKKAID